MLSPRGVKNCDTTQASNPPIDLQHLKRQTLDNSDLQREVLQLFKRQSVLFIEKIRAALNADICGRAAHTIKGSARGIGAWQVAEFAQNIEMSCDDAARPAHLQQLEMAVAEVNAYIEQLQS